MTFRGISSISGGAFGGNANARTGATTGGTSEGPFTLPRKGYGASAQRPVGGTVGSMFRGVQDQVHPSALTSTGTALTMSGMTFTPRPPMQPQNTVMAQPGSLSQRIMSASAARPTTSGNSVTVPNGQSQNPRAFGLDLASLLANLDAGSATARGAQSTSYGATPSTPASAAGQPALLSNNTAADAQRKLFAPTVPQVPLGPRIPSAGRTIPATFIPSHQPSSSQYAQPAFPKPTAVEEVVQDEPIHHSPSERVEVPKMDPAPSASSSDLSTPVVSERVPPAPLAARDAMVIPPDGSNGKMTPAEALGFYDRFLSRYERREILEYDEVYFVGMAAQKVDAPVQEGLNFGYDDERGDYIVTKGDHIAFRYEVISELGKGSFGQVLKVHDHKKNMKCALKIIRNKKRFHQQATVEIRILDHLRSRDPEDRSCTVRMLNYFKFRSHTIVTFEMHSMNLYELAKLNKYQPFAPALIKRFTAQILVAMSFMWREQIVHCDLKPENILLRYENKTSIKIIDFGSSCFESERIYTYIQSRFYRAPEIILGMPYGRPIDLWSLGCIVCEMQMGYPIFPGESEKEQLLCIMEILGVPPQRLVDRSPRKKDFFDSNGSPRLFPNSRNKTRKPATKELMKTLRTDDASFVDFVLCFFQWEPAERMTPNEAMRHPWIAECFQQDTVQTQPTTGTPRPRLNSARPSHHAGSSGTATTSAAPHQGTQVFPPSVGSASAPNALPSIDLTVMPNSAKGINAWRLTNRKIGSAQTSRTMNQLAN